MVIGVIALIGSSIALTAWARTPSARMKFADHGVPGQQEFARERLETTLQACLLAAGVDADSMLFGRGWEGAPNVVRLQAPVDLVGLNLAVSEAVEGAVKMARKTSGRQGVIVFRGGFHGRTMGSVTFTTSKAKYRQGYHPLVGSVFVTPFPHPYRWGLTQEDATARARTLRLEHMICGGTTTVEAKSGYGLSLADEAKLLRLDLRLPQPEAGRLAACGRRAPVRAP